MLTAFAVYDCKAEAYGMPIFQSNRGLALRSFSDACADMKSPMSMHPEDYALYEIGSYDPNKGLLTDLTPAKHIVSASSVVALLRPASVPQDQQPDLPSPVPVKKEST